MELLEKTGLTAGSIAVKMHLYLHKILFIFDYDDDDDDDDDDDGDDDGDDYNGNIDADADADDDDDDDDDNHLDDHDHDNENDDDDDDDNLAMDFIMYATFSPSGFQKLVMEASMGGSYECMGRSGSNGEIKVVVSDQALDVVPLPDPDLDLVASYKVKRDAMMDTTTMMVKTNAFLISILFMNF